MGGNAFKSLHCPRVPTEVYVKVNAITTAALQTVFAHVTVPFEIPGKADYGDIDFLVSAPFGDSTELSLTTFPFPTVIESIKHALDTPHGRRGFLTPDCMYFAILMPASTSSSTATSLAGSQDSDDDRLSWVQVDVKICLKPEMFSWMTFELNYASQSGILGSMIKPLGLTLDPQGLHIRVEEIEVMDWPGSLVWVTKNPWMVCRVLGLGRRVVDGGFMSAEEIYEEYAGSWLFRPENFKAKFGDESYLVQHSHRSNFLKKWIPEYYPDYQLNAEQHEDLQNWTSRTRAAVREKVFTMFPQIATEYYTKRSSHVKEVEEYELREVTTAAIPSGTDGWREDFSMPKIIIRQSATQEAPSTPHLRPALLQHGQLTPPPSSDNVPIDLATSSPKLDATLLEKHSTPVYIDALPRQPPHSCKPSPPPQSMSAAARLACLARWTAFTPTGTPYLLSSPHAKDFDLQWLDAIESGFSEQGLVEWAREMWWAVWVRQCVVNWRGIWAKRFEKEDVKAETVRKEAEEATERARVEEEGRKKAEELVEKQRKKVLGRLEGLNKALRLVEVKE